MAKPIASKMATTMTRPAPAPTVSYLTPPETQAAPAPVPEEDLDPIEMVLRDLSVDAGSYIQVQRVLKGDQRVLEQCGRYTSDVAEDEAGLADVIRQDWGPGCYRLHFRLSNGLRANRRFDIAAPRSMTQAPAPAAQPVPDVLLQVLQRMGDQITALTQVFQHQQQPARTPDQIEDAAIARMRTIAEMLRPQQGPDATAMMNTFMQGLTMGRELQPATGAGTEDVLVSALQSFAPMMQRAMTEQRPAPRQQAQPRQAALPQPTQAPEAKPAAPLPEVVADPIPQEWRPLFAMLVRAAKTDSDPDLYAPMVIDQIGMDYCEAILAHEDPVGALAQYAPVIEPHKPWVARLLDSMRAAMYEPDTEPPAVDAAVTPTGP